MSERHRIFIPPGTSILATANAAAGVAGITGGGTVMSLANATLKAMFVAKVKAVAAVCAAAVVVGAGVPTAVTLAQAATEEKSKAPPPAMSSAASDRTLVTGMTGASVVAWGAVTNELQAGLMPLGGMKGDGWAGERCRECTHARLITRKEASLAVARRVCAICGAPKPWSATFVEGKPMRMELHFRNLAKEKRSLNDPFYVGHWEFTFTPVGGNTSFYWTAFYAVKDARIPGPDIKLGVGEINENAVDLELGVSPRWHYRCWNSASRSFMPPVNKSLPAGKYTVSRCK